MKQDGNVPEKQGSKCPTCGRIPVFGAQFCPYCGANLAAAATGRAILPIPDRKTLAGDCAVLFCGDGQFDIRRAGRLVSEALKRPLGDVTRTMKISKGIIADGMDAAAAADLAGQLEAEGVPVLLLPDKDLHNVPPVMRMKSAGFGREGMRCEAYLWDATEHMSLAWRNVLLVSCGRLQLSEVVEVENETPEEEGRSRPRRRLKLPGCPEIPELATETWHEYVMDIFCDDPWVRLRLDENTAAYALVDVGSLTEGKRAFYKAAGQIVKNAPDVPVNEGVKLLASNAPAELWEGVIFEDKRDFDRYNMWLLQLARHGYPIGA